MVMFGFGIYNEYILSLVNKVFGILSHKRKVMGWLKIPEAEIAISNFYCKNESR